MKNLLIFLLMLLSGCAFITKPEVTVKDVKLTGLDNGGVDLDFYLSVNNRNSFDLKMKGYSYDVRIMALPLARGASHDTYNFYAKSATDVLIPVKISFDNVIEVLKRHPNPDAIPYQLHADLTVDTTLGDMVIPTNKSGTICVPKEFRPSNMLKNIGDFLKTLEKK
jgi:LEA14-like dessication related protein